MSFIAYLSAFAADLTAKFATPLHFNPEDQLKAPMMALLRAAAGQLDVYLAATVRAFIEFLVTRFSGCQTGLLSRNFLV